MEDKAC